MRYLLGTLSEAEREQLEEKYFSDDDEFENLESAEDDVIDRYVRGKLTATEIGRFEKLLASSPRLAERVKLARILSNQIESRQQELVGAGVVAIKDSGRPSWWNRWFGPTLHLTPAFRAATVAGIALVILSAIGLIGWMNSRRVSQQLASEKGRIELEIQQLKQQINEQGAKTKELDAELQAKQQELEATEKMLAELRSRQPDETPQTVATLISLFPGAVRSEGSKRDFTLRPNSSDVEFTLFLRSNEHSHYNVIVETVERQVVHRVVRVQPRGSGNNATIRFRVPAKRVTPRDYIVRVEAAGSNEPVDEYFFRIVPGR